MTEPFTVPEHLAVSECWRLMRTQTVARLAFSDLGVQEIFPVNYLVDSGSILVRTSAASPIMRCVDNRPVAVETDHVDEVTAWSVVGKGSAVLVRGLHDNLSAAEVPVHPLSAGNKSALIRIEVTSVTGRRFPVASPLVWEASQLSGPRQSID